MDLEKDLGEVSGKLDVVCKLVKKAQNGVDEVLQWKSRNEEQIKHIEQDIKEIKNIDIDKRMTLLSKEIENIKREESKKEKEENKEEKKIEKWKDKIWELIKLVAAGFIAIGLKELIR